MKLRPYNRSNRFALTQEHEHEAITLCGFSFVSRSKPHQQKLFELMKDQKKRKKGCRVYAPQIMNPVATSVILYPVLFLRLPKNHQTSIVHSIDYAINRGNDVDDLVDVGIIVKRGDSDDSEEDEGLTAMVSTWISFHLEGNSFYDDLLKLITARILMALIQISVLMAFLSCLLHTVYKRNEVGVLTDKALKKLSKDGKKTKHGKTISLKKKDNGSDENHVFPTVIQAADKDDTEEDDDDVQWQTDTSAATARQRIQEQLSTVDGCSLCQCRGIKDTRLEPAYGWCCVRVPGQS
ncbi:Armadillo-type fold [Artemisia annua]|uniref:Armadillo-type fold n=1 Tax=Artemisia annua TaxID=35608 RepID=A0A2U1QDH0_ARTAN|nr:Armadillo-type fold [Artemisia annua]